MYVMSLRVGYLSVISSACWRAINRVRPHALPARRPHQPTPTSTPGESHICPVPVSPCRVCPRNHAGLTQRPSNHLQQSCALISTAACQSKSPSTTAGCFSISPLGAGAGGAAVPGHPLGRHAGVAGGVAAGGAPPHRAPARGAGRRRRRHEAHLPGMQRHSPPSLLHVFGV